MAVSGPGTAKKEAVVCEAVIDTTGSKSIIDANSAAQYGLEVHLGNASYFWGPGNKAEHYYGKVEGLLMLQFDTNLKMVLLELKVFKGTCKDPFFIVGSNVMAPEHPGEWDFLNIGFNPQDKCGVMNFIHGNGSVRQVDLASWPQQASLWVYQNTKAAESKAAPSRSKKPMKTVQWADKKKNHGKYLIVLLREQGQRVLWSN